MKFKYLLLVFFSISFLSFSKFEIKNINAELVDIQYYSVNDCQEEHPIYVRVIYKVNFNDLSSLKIKNEYNNNVCTTLPVTEIDKKGNIVYSFCSCKNENKSFSTTFISSNGERSNKIKVEINYSNANIISGTAPNTIKIN